MKNKGITLIALVVTIVVLLILAGVSITAVFGEGGIISLAQDAAEKTKEAEDKTLTDLNNVVDEMDKLLDEEIKDPTTVNEALARKTPFKGTTQITDGKDKMWVPEGFTVTEGKNIEDGVVVQDPDKNEFVWVPVKTINNMVYCYDHPASEITYNEKENQLECSQCKSENKQTTNFAGKLYAIDVYVGNYFDENTAQTGYNKNNSSYNERREPDVISEYNGKQYDSDENNLKIVLEKYKAGDSASTFKTQLQTEFNEMAKSVGKYKGFYIGRYETSNLSDKGDTYTEVSQGKVLKNKTSINNTNWYRQYVSNKKIGSNYIAVATTNMIWGCQWDQVMLWMKDILNPNVEGEKYIKNSTGMGNYKGTQGELDKIIPTGSNENYVVKNIYDMAGNVIEYTIEFYHNPDRVNRGGFFGNAGSDFPASSSNSWVLEKDDGSRGSRAMLYINS